MCMLQKRSSSAWWPTRGRRMTGSAVSAMDVLINAIAFFNRRRVREEVRGGFAGSEGRRMTGSAMKCNEMEMDVVCALLLVEKV